MNSYKKYIIGFACVALLSPVLASADAIGDLQNQIQSLLSQIRTLQTQIQTIEHASSTSIIMGTSTPPRDDRGEGRDDRKFCVSLERNIGIGMRGDDVKNIQMMLAQDPTLYNGTTTGYFGPQTAQAMAKFQVKFGIASTSTGFVGQMTREFFGRQCPPPLRIASSTPLMIGSTTPPRRDDIPRPQGMIGSTTPPMPPFYRTEYDGDARDGRMMSTTTPTPPARMGERR